MLLGGALASFVTLIIAAAQWRWIFVLGGVMPLLVAPAIAGALLPESLVFRALRSGSASSQGNEAAVSAVLGEGAPAEPCCCG